MSPKNKPAFIQKMLRKRRVIKLQAEKEYAEALKQSIQFQVSSGNCSNRVGGKQINHDTSLGFDQLETAREKVLIQEQSVDVSL